MNVREEIELYASESDKPILNWLLTTYRWQSQFTFVAKCTFRKLGPGWVNSVRVWSPTPEGRILYNHHMKNLSSEMYRKEA